MSTEITIGDTVRVRGVRSPKMIVLDQTFTDDDTVYNCLWFDMDQCARTLSLKAAFVELATPDTSTFGSIPVYGVAS